MKFSFRCMKCSLIALNVIYLLIAFILIGIAAYAHLSIYITSVQIVAGIIACGVFLFILALVGLVGSLRHDQAVLFFYIILMFSLFLVQFSVACACLSLNNDNQRAIVESAWAQCDNATKVDVMKAFQCCGLRRVDIPSSLPMGHPPCKLAKLPCCETPAGLKAPCCQGNLNVTEKDIETCPCLLTCWTVIERKLETGVRATGATSLVFSVIEVFGVWLALRYRHQRDPQIDPNRFLQSSTYF